MKLIKICMTALLMTLMVAASSIQMCPANFCAPGNTYEVTTVYGGKGQPFTYGWREPADDGSHKAKYDPNTNSMYAYVLAPFWGQSQSTAMLQVQHELLSNMQPVKVSVRIRYIWESSGFGIARKSAIAFDARMLGQGNRVETYSVPSITIPVPVVHEAMLMIESGRTAWDIYDFLNKSGSPPDTWPYCDLNFVIPGNFPRGTTDKLTISATSWSVAALATSWSKVFVWIEYAKVTEAVEPTISITGTDPQNTGKNVPVNSEIKVLFSGPVEKASIERAFHINPSVTGTFSWNASDQMIFKPSTPLSFKTAYTATIDGTAKDTKGVSLVNIPYTWKFETVEMPKPDIIVKSISFTPSTALVGETVTITVTVQNIGNLEAAGVGYASFNVYDGTTLIAFPRGGPGQGPLQPEETWSLVVWMDSFTTSGTHTIRVVVDPENKVTESNETNNEATTTIDIVGKDFTITAYPAGMTIAQGKEATSTITITSIGGFSADISLRCDIRTTKPNITAFIPEKLSLSANGKATAILTVRIAPDSSPGTATIGITASGGGKTHYVNVYIEVPKPDLVWFELECSPEFPKSGDSPSIKAILMNRGLGIAPSGYTIRLEIYELYYGEYYELVYSKDFPGPQLKPGEIMLFSYQTDFTFKPTYYKIVLTVDADNVVEESNEDNNSETAEFWVEAQPSLTLTSLSTAVILNTNCQSYSRIHPDGQRTFNELSDQISTPGKLHKARALHWACNPVDDAVSLLLIGTKKL